MYIKVKENISNNETLYLRILLSYNIIKKGIM